VIAWPTETISFSRWAAELRVSRPDIDINPIAPSEDQWREWGNHVNQSSVCQTFNTPRTENFQDWRSWAIAFIRSFGPNA
jgi:hypothetical protein